MSGYLNKKEKNGDSESIYGTQQDSDDKKTGRQDHKVSSFDSSVDLEAEYIKKNTRLEESSHDV